MNKTIKTPPCYSDCKYNEKVDSCCRGDSKPCFRVRKHTNISDEDNFYKDCEQSIGWSGDYYAHHD